MCLVPRRISERESVNHVGVGGPETGSDTGRWMVTDQVVGGKTSKLNDERNMKSRQERAWVNGVLWDVSEPEPEPVTFRAHFLSLSLLMLMLPLLLFSKGRRTGPAVGLVELSWWSGWLTKTRACTSPLSLFRGVSGAACGRGAADSHHSSGSFVFPFLSHFHFPVARGIATTDAIQCQLIDLNF